MTQTDLKTRKVQVFACYSDQSWLTHWVDIPLDTASDAIEHVAIDALLNMLLPTNPTLEPPVHAGLHCLPPLEEWGNEEEEWKNDDPYTRSQLILVARCIMYAALERIDGEIEAPQRRAMDAALTAYERGALEAAGMALAVFYVQVSKDDEGMTIGDALGCSGVDGVAFDDMIRSWVVDACNRNVYSEMPDARPWAEAWVERLFPEVA